MLTFDNIPEVSFAPSSAQVLLDEMITDYEQAYKAETGQSISVPPSSETRILLYTFGLQLYHAYQLIDNGCKMNLPKYSTGAYLDNLAALLGIIRLPAQPSYSRVEFTLVASQSGPTLIPKGTRVSTTDHIFFATQEELVIPAGALSGSCDVQSAAPGADTSGFLPGQLNILVDPVPFVAEARNIQPTQGGADIESDDSLRLRVLNFTDSLSVAGPESAYRYFIESFSQAIEGVSIESPAPGEVDIRITLTGGELPEQPFIDALFNYLEDKRPLTDQLQIAAPDIVEYAVDCTYYIAKSDSPREVEIIQAVEQAAQDYIQWQGARIGLDIIPDTLTALIREAGAKRAVIISPTFTVVPAGHIPKCASLDLNYGGIEDD